MHLTGKIVQLEPARLSVNRNNKKSFMSDIARLCCKSPFSLVLKNSRGYSEVEQVGYAAFRRHKIDAAVVRIPLPVQLQGASACRG